MASNNGPLIWNGRDAQLINPNGVILDRASGLYLTPYSASGLSENLRIDSSIAASAMTFTVLSESSGAAPTSDTRIKMAFSRPGTTSAVNTRFSLAGAQTITIPSTATLGHANATASYIYVYYCNNGAGGTGLGVSSSFYEPGTILGTTTTISAAATSASVVYMGTGTTNVGVFPLARFVSSQTTAGTWAANTTAACLWPFQNLVQSKLVLDTYSSYASTNTTVPRWTNATYSGQGLTDFTYTNSATLGGSIAVNRPGLYSSTINWASATGVSDALAMSLNYSTAGGAVSVPLANQLGLSSGLAGSGGNTFISVVSFTERFSAGDSFRPYTQNATVPVGSNYCRWSIRRIGD